MRHDSNKEDIHRIIRDEYEQLDTNILLSQKKQTRFWKHKTYKLNHE